MNYDDPVELFGEAYVTTWEEECRQPRRRIQAVTDATVEGLQSKQPALFIGLLTAQ
jgi:hypothetical protein